MEVSSARKRSSPSTRITPNLNSSCPTSGTGRPRPSRSSALGSVIGSIVNDYCNMLFNQVLPVLGEELLVNCRGWDKGCRQKGLDLQKGIEAKGSLYQSEKYLMMTRSMIASAIDNRWMQSLNPAPGSSGAQLNHKIISEVKQFSQLRFIKCVLFLIAHNTIKIKFLQ